jgi:hypothetical protein
MEQSQKFSSSIKEGFSRGKTEDKKAKERIAEAKKVAERFGVNEGFRQLIELSKGRLVLKVTTSRSNHSLPLTYMLNCPHDKSGHVSERAFIAFDSNGAFTTKFPGYSADIFPLTEKGRRKKLDIFFEDLAAELARDKIISMVPPHRPKEGTASQVLLKKDR